MINKRNQTKHSLWLIPYDFSSDFIHYCEKINHTVINCFCLIKEMIVVYDWWDICNYVSRNSIEVEDGIDSIYLADSIWTVVSY